MSPRFVIALLLASALTLSLAVSPCPAQDADAEGWIVLFNGKNLDGWHVNPGRIGHGTGGRWYVEDGVITGEQDPPGSGNGGILLTDRKFGDSELMIDMKPDWGVCSGLFLRANDRGQCLQMMVDYHDNGDVGHIYGEGVGGFNNRPFLIEGVYNNNELREITTKPSGEQVPKAFSCTGAQWVKAWKVGDWNTAHVRVEGNPAHITTWLNGVKVSEFDGATYDGPRYNKDNVAKTLGAEGSIAVQVHGGRNWPKGSKCRWRNVKVKPL